MPAAGRAWAPSPPRSDSRGGTSTARADSILLMRTDPGKHLISLLSIPRDLRVSIAGHGDSKINSAFAR